MNPFPILLGAALLGAVTNGARADLPPGTVARVAWEFPAVVEVRGADELVATLRTKIQRVLDAGRLAPLYISHADQESVGYTVYQEPGRIITTLAWAYPHLSPPQQEAVRAYVNDELRSAVHAPWGITAQGRDGTSNFPLPRDAGAAREEHPRERWWYARKDFGLHRPFLHTLYGVWLYGHRSGDWAASSNHWDAIRAAYDRHGDAAAYRLYGTLGLHVAVVRFAERFGDAGTRDRALAALESRLEAGLDFAAVESWTRGTPGDAGRSPYGSYPNMYDPRMDGSTYRGWMFLDLTPEVGRFLREASPELRAAVAARHATGKARFPLWWIPKASYFNRSWTGDEGSGLVPEVLGMIAPVERWVLEADAAQWRRYLRSAPNGRGDCHWLEALVQGIEAHGRLRWVDVRRETP